MNKESLRNKIASKLEQLNKAIQKARDTVIDSQDENDWDYDHYSGLASKLEKSLALLNDKVVPGKKDEFGDPIILEKGILTLLDEWKEDGEESDSNHV